MEEGLATGRPTSDTVLIEYGLDIIHAADWRDHFATDEWDPLSFAARVQLGVSEKGGNTDDDTNQLVHCYFDRRTSGTGQKSYRERGKGTTARRPSIQTGRFPTKDKGR